MIQHVRGDLLDIGKVNGISWGTIGLSQADFMTLNEAIQSAGNSILVLIAVGYTCMKVFKIVREMRWDKEDREEQISDKDNE